MSSIFLRDDRVVDGDARSCPLTVRELSEMLLPSITSLDRGVAKVVAEQRGFEILKAAISGLCAFNNDPQGAQGLSPEDIVKKATAIVCLLYPDNAGDLA